jgi:hypothetical protein
MQTQSTDANSPFNGLTEVVNVVTASGNQEYSNVL